jgi:manganese transport protein
VASGVAIRRRETVGEALRHGRVRGPLRLLGPAFVASIAYVDPGNFATNITGGARYGYLLLWVIVAANAMAMLVQYLSSKVGLVTGRSLPELCRDRYPTGLRWLLWIQAEVIAMATDVAEVLGAAIALHLLFGWPPLVGGIVTAVVALVILALSHWGFRRFEVAIALFMAVIVVAFAGLVLAVDVHLPAMAGGLVPRLADGESVAIAVGILGATVMPHVVYLHSALVSDRIRPVDARDVRTLLRFTRADVVLAMCIAGAVNVALLVVAAAAFHGDGAPIVRTLDDAYRGIGAVLGPGVALGFVVALLASGLSSSSVGTMSGQIVMSGFIDRRIPLGVRRLVTISPAILALGLGLEPTVVLVASQVVLSFGIPFAVIPLVHLTASRPVMGAFVNARRLTVAACAVASVVVALNLYFLATIVVLG